ncbi:MAG TPA: hypothetical protein VFO21_01025 [Vicinamibacterales bacterium]|nr:hypothetical protein [Vicinamibacterales bacterium]
MALITRVLVVALIVVLAPRAAAPQSPVPLTREQMERFLATAEIVRERTTSDGVTRPVRATLSNGVLTHDAQFQTVDQAKALFDAGKASEIGFTDTYRYNIAGYRLAQLVGLDTVPMSVERRYKGKNAAVTWWIDDVMFDESGRMKLGDTAMMGPDPQRTQRQIHVMRVWDELIQNRDRNRGNVLWTKDWTLWLIDHTRAFRTNTSLLKPDELIRIERTLFDKMKQLTEQSISQAMKGALTRPEIRSLLRRRDALVQHFEKLIAGRGEGAVFFTLSPATGQ